MADPSAPPQQKPRRETLFVYIVESPSAPDLYHGRSEGSLVVGALGLGGIDCVTRTAINPEAFAAALRIGLPDTMKQFPGRYPILHISAHGGPNGIQLSSGDVITWAMLREFLVPINESLQGILLLCMSACEGYSACRMAMYVENKPDPYYVMIGNYGRPTWSDTAVAYLAFYHMLFKGVPIRDAVEAMKHASGDTGWMVETAEEIKRGYVEFVESKRPSDAAQKDLEAVADLEALPADAKALERSSGG